MKTLNIHRTVNLYATPNQWLRTMQVDLHRVQGQRIRRVLSLRYWHKMPIPRLAEIELAIN